LKNERSETAQGSVFIALVVLLVLFASILGELGAYYWHRFISHGGWWVPEFILESHRQHHRGEWNHLAIEDFCWVVLMLTIIILMLGLLVLLLRKVGLDVKVEGFISFIPLPPAVVGVVVVVSAVLAIVLNWSLHSLVHSTSEERDSEGGDESKDGLVEEDILGNSFLTSLATVHSIHHHNPRCNYSILGIGDTLHGSWKCRSIPEI